ncbi:EAL domain-containing protein [Sphingomonas sp. BN140010]|uniref:EAL domain-containing protein n=1 Tax=Sphingomonas arvum TaxID=2992113 RepID=A0ABT3JGT5_9SPHN|nr:EAL domain-containing protein [Sphingomonas sp. BN140010]MCW3798268.1 EAL domain-containing protein [Sphingomonas sp. BN140010]
MLLLVIAAGWGTPAAARQVEQLAYGPSAACRPADATNWTFVQVQPPRSAELGRDWRLMIDHTRFSALRIAIARTNGPPLLLGGRTAELSGASTLGNRLVFAVPVAPAAVTRICLGFRDLDDLSLMRSVKALSPAAFERHVDRWLVLVSAVCGVLFCALAYNLFLMTWLRSDFQRWNVVWLASGLTYTLFWTGGVYLFAPGLDGALRVRADFVLVSILVGSATGFFFDFVERGKMPEGLVKAGLVCSALIPLAGALAALDWLLPARPADLALNVLLVISIGLVGAGICHGIRRGSRAVWFYLAAWTAPMIVLMLRVGRNFGLLSQSDLVDMASFVAIAFEAVILSIAVADRFREFLRQRDAADAERDTLRRVANTDALTGLANRAAFQARIATLGQHSGADLLIVDLDDLKEANDSAGHDAGDALIIEAGRRLTEAAGGRGLVARIGGDEFAVLLVDEERGGLPPVLELVGRSGGQRLSHGGQLLAIGLSGGLSSWTAGDGSPDRLAKEADLALYRAKADGRGCWRAYSSAICDEQEARRWWITQARTGLERGELELHYQPIVDLRTQEVSYHEALLRWRHPERGLIRPGEFNQAFDDQALSLAIQNWVLEVALDALQTGRTAGELKAISVNFLACQLQGRRAARHILGRLASRGLPPSALTVEVTENVVLGRPGGPVVECLRWLRKEGVGVSLDDFGTGYASLVHLRELPADVLKIDRSFIAGLERDVESTMIVRAIVSLAHNLGRKVVAEGIETDDQREYLRRLGCDLGQGHLLGRPRPLARVAAPSRNKAA